MKIHEENRSIIDRCKAWEKVVVCPITRKETKEKRRPDMPEISPNLFVGKISREAKGIMRLWITLICKKCDTLSVMNPEVFKKHLWKKWMRDVWVKKWDIVEIQNCPLCSSVFTF